MLDFFSLAVYCSNYCPDLCVGLLVHGNPRRGGGGGRERVDRPGLRHWSLMFRRRTATSCSVAHVGYSPRYFLPSRSLEGQSGNESDSKSPARFESVFRPLPFLCEGTDAIKNRVASGVTYIRPCALLPIEPRGRSEDGLFSVTKLLPCARQSQRSIWVGFFSNFGTSLMCPLYCNLSHLVLHEQYYIVTFTCHSSMFAASDPVRTVAAHPQLLRRGARADYGRRGLRGPGRRKRRQRGGRVGVLGLRGGLNLGGGIRRQGQGRRSQGGESIVHGH